MSAKPRTEQTKKRFTSKQLTLSDGLTMGLTHPFQKISKILEEDKFSNHFAATKDIMEALELILRHKV